MTLRGFIESTWFKGLARGSMIIVAILLGYASAVLNGVQERTKSVEIAVAEIKESQAVRSRDNENFQAATLKSFSGLETDIAGLRIDVARSNSELGKITGILTEMQRQDVANILRYRGPLAEWEP